MPEKKPHQVKLRVGAAQMISKSGDVEANVAAALSYCDKAAKKGVQVLCFPECASTGYEWIIDGENGYLAPLNAEQWASAVQAAAEFGETQRKQNSQSVKARISSDVIDKQYLRLMNTLAETAPGQAVDVEQVLSS